MAASFQPLHVDSKQQAGEHELLPFHVSHLLRFLPTQYYSSHLTDKHLRATYYSKEARKCSPGSVTKEAGEWTLQYCNWQYLQQTHRIIITRCLAIGIADQLVILHLKV